MPQVRFRETPSGPDPDLEFEDFIVACAEVSREPIRRQLNWKEWAWRWGAGLGGFGLGLVIGASLRRAGDSPISGPFVAEPPANPSFDAFTQARMTDHNVHVSK